MRSTFIWGGHYPLKSGFHIRRYRFSIFLYSECREGLFVCTEFTCQRPCQITEYVPGNCSTNCGWGVVYGTATVIVEPLYGGEACPELVKPLDDCFAGDCGMSDFCSFARELSWVAWAANRPGQSWSWPRGIRRLVSWTRE